jgi:hypothetical protein
MWAINIKIKVTPNVIAHGITYDDKVSVLILTKGAGIGIEVLAGIPIRYILKFDFLFLFTFNINNYSNNINIK